MSKSRGAAPTRGLRAPTMTPKHPALDPLRVAAEIVAALADAVVVTGLDRKVLTANRSAAELFGRRLADLPGTPIDDLVTSEERQHVAEREHRAFEGEQQRYETTVVRVDGEERNVAVSTTPLVLDGDLVGTVATLRDITEEKGAQDALARSEARYRNLFERSEEHTSELQSRLHLVCRLLLEKKKKQKDISARRPDVGSDHERTQTVTAIHTQAGMLRSHDASDHDRWMLKSMAQTFLTRSVTITYVT